MSYPILITGAAGGPQGSTGRLVAGLLLQQGIPVRAFVHKVDARSDELRQQGAEIIEGHLLNPATVQAAINGVRRAYFTYPVADGLLETATIFAAAAREGGLELVVNNSQFHGTPDEPDLRLGAGWGRSSAYAALLRKCTRSRQPGRSRTKYRLPAVGG